MDINEVLTGVDRLFSANRISEVERYLTQMLSEAEYENDRDAIMTIYNELINFHRTTGESDKALYFCRQALRYAKRENLEDNVRYGMILMSVGDANRMAGNLLEALAYYRKAEEVYLAQLGSADIRLAAYYKSVAVLYQELGDYDNAATALGKALKIIERHENAGNEIVATYASLGECLLRSGKLEEAKDRLSDAVRRYQLKGDRGEHYCAALSALAEVWYREGSYEQALGYYELAAEGIYRIYGDNETYKVILGNIETVKAKIQQ